MQSAIYMGADITWNVQDSMGMQFLGNLNMLVSFLTSGIEMFSIECAVPVFLKLQSIYLDFLVGHPFYIINLILLLLSPFIVLSQYTVLNLQSKDTPS